MKRLALFLSVLLPLAAAAQEVIEVTLREGTNMALALSPDGQTIAIDLQGRLWRLPVGGGSARALTDELGDVRQPSYAPDGESLAFQSYRDGTWHIWAVGADGEGLEQVTHGPYDDREPHWSHDGNRIAFSSDRGGTYDLWTIELATGELTQLTRDAGNEFTPVAPDDESLAFVSEQESSKALKTLRAGAQTVVLDIEGSAPAPAMESGRRADRGQYCRGTLEPPRSRRCGIGDVSSMLPRER